MVQNNTAAALEDHLPFFKKTHTVLEFGKPIDVASMDREQKKNSCQWCAGSYWEDVWGKQGARVDWFKEGGQDGGMLYFQTRSRSWKDVAVLGALPHLVRCVCQVPTPFQRSETTTYLHPDLTLHPIYSLLWFPVGKPCLLGVVFLLTYWQKPTNSPYSICFVCQ